MTDIYERLADENEPAPATAPAAQLTGDQASDLMASLTVEDSDATHDPRRPGWTHSGRPRAPRRTPSTSHVTEPFTFHSRFTFQVIR